MKSLTKNSFFYLIYEVLNVFFPLVTGIYVARMLLPEQIGEVAYAQNIVQYFVILSYLGIPTYGMREIAKCRDDKEKLNKLFSELFIINLVSTVFFLIIYILLVLVTPSLKENWLLYAIVGSQIALNALNITWLFTGLEEFQFISIRNIVFKIVNFALLVLLVRHPEDYLFYAAITVIGTAGNYIVNVGYAPRFVKFTTKNLCLKRHMKSIIYLVAVNLAIEIYTLVDVTMLGVMRPKSTVAFYSYGNKIYKILLQVMNTFTIVIVPRLAYYYSKQNHREFNELVTKTLKVLVLLGLPMIVGIQFLANDAVTIMYGSGYSSSATVLRILSLMIIVSPIGYLLGSRMLLISKQENKMLICVSLGAVVNVIGNYILIQKYSEYGAAIASVLSEIVVMLVYLYMGKEIYTLKITKRFFVQGAFALCIMSLFLVSMNFLIKTHGIISVLINVAGACIVYIVSLVIVKEETAIGMKDKMVSIYQKQFCRSFRREK